MDKPTTLTLYYFPGSYYSRRVLLALYEKNVPFHRKKVNIHAKEQYEDWYMRMNVLGEVPVLKDGDLIISNSDDIIQYIDEHFETGNTLIPRQDSQAGRDIRDFCKLLNTIQIDRISYGVWMHPKSSPTAFKLLRFFMTSPEGLKRRMLCDVANLNQKAEQFADLRDAYLAKVKKWEAFIDDISDKDNILSHLDDLEIKFKRAEAILEKSRADAGVQSSEVWLFGPRFTMADVYLTILMDRMVLLGMESRYFSIDKNPNAFRYFEHVRCRKNVKKIAKEMNMWFLISYIVHNSVPTLGRLSLGGLLVLGLGVGLVVAWKSK